MGQVCVLHMPLDPDQLAMCTPVLPLHLSHGTLSQKGPDSLIFNGVVPVTDIVPTQSEMVDGIVRSLNEALAQHQQKEEENKTPPSSQTQLVKAPKFGPVLSKPGSSDKDDRYVILFAVHFLHILPI